MYYKRNDSKKWKGPGTVIGQDSQQVLIKHGGIYVRVHPCRIMLEMKNCDNLKEQVSEDSQISQCNTYQSSEKVAQPVVADSISELSSDSEVDNLSSDDIQSNCDNENNQTNLNDSNSINEQDDRSENVLCNPENAPNYENQSFPRATKPKKNSQIDCLPTDGDEWLSGKVLGRAGKATGKYGHH